VAIMLEEAGWIGDLLDDGAVIEPKAEAEMRQAASEITTQGKRCREITHKLLSFARKTESLIVPADLGQVAAEIAGLARQKAKFAGVALEVRAQENLPLVCLSVSEMQQILLNLINNAIDAVSAAGRKDGRVAVGVARLGDKVVLSVGDNGPGIAPEAADRLFDPFFTTKPAGEGTGLGLSICHGLVAKMGGEIRVESEPGRGATFFVSLPAQDARPGCRGKPVPGRSRTGRVLTGQTRPHQPNHSNPAEPGRGGPGPARPVAHGRVFSSRLGGLRGAPVPAAGNARFGAGFARIFSRSRHFPGAKLYHTKIVKFYF